MYRTIYAIAWITLILNLFCIVLFGTIIRQGFGLKSNYQESIRIGEDKVQTIRSFEPTIENIFDAADSYQRLLRGSVSVAEDSNDNLILVAGLCVGICCIGVVLPILLLNKLHRQTIDSIE